MKSASRKISAVPGRETSVMCALGSTRRSSRRAGTVSTASPTQFVPRTTTRLIWLGCGSLAFKGINSAIYHLQDRHCLSKPFCQSALRREMLTVFVVTICFQAPLGTEYFAPEEAYFQLWQWAIDIWLLQSRKPGMLPALSDQTSQPFLHSNLWLPTQLFADARQIGNIIQRHRHGQRRVFINHRVALNYLRYLVDHFAQ